MSRQNWMNAGRSELDARSTDWRVAFSHVTLEGRTSDPEALEWDEADEIFRSGLRCARRGDLEAGRAQFINPPNEGSGPEQYDLELVVLSDEAPEEVVQSYKDRFTTGELQEGNTAFYILSRQVYSMSLLVKVFDTYQ